MWTRLPSWHSCNQLGPTRDPTFSWIYSVLYSSVTYIFWSWLTSLTKIRMLYQSYLCECQHYLRSKHDEVPFFLWFAKWCCSLEHEPHWFWWCLYSTIMGLSMWAKILSLICSHQMFCFLLPMPASCVGIDFSLFEFPPAKDSKGNASILDVTCHLFLYTKKCLSKYNVLPCFVMWKER